MDSWLRSNDGRANGEIGSKGTTNNKTNSFLSGWYHRVKESYVAAWFCRMFQTGRMSSAPGGGAASGGGGSAGGGAVGGALSLMGCVREASPPPQDHHLGHGGFGMQQQRNVDTLPKEPKKRRFHPLRGLRRIFRRKSRGAADARLGSRNGDRDGDLITRDREEVTLRHPAGRPEEARSRSASELLTDSCDHESVFLRRTGAEESYAKLRGVSGQLSVSHDSVFPGEVPHTRPLSLLDPLATLERRQTKASDEGVHKDYSSRIAHSNRISLRVLEQIKTVIENRNQVASSTSNESTHTSHATGERYQQETTENRFAHFDKHERTVEESFIRVTRNSEDVADRENLTPKEDLPQLECASLNHTAAHHRISVRPKNRRPPRRGAATSTTTPTTSAGLTSSSISGSSTITTISESPDVSASPEATTGPSNTPSSPIEMRKSSSGGSALRKSSTRLSRNSEIFDELEAKMPSRKPASVTSLSPDSLDSMTAFGRASSGQEADSEDASPREAKPALVVRKASSRVSKGSEAMYEELEAKLPSRNRSSSINRLSKSPDSLESLSTMTGSFSRSTEQMIPEKSTTEQYEESRLSASRKSSNSKSSSSEHGSFFEPSKQQLDNEDETGVEIRPRRLHNHRQISKSIEGFDKLTENEETRVVARRYSNVVMASNKRESDSTMRCADSLDAIENISLAVASDDSIELRRSSFELAPRKSTPKLMSMSSENFEALEHARDDLVMRPELKKRSSVSDVNLSRGGARRYSRVMSKSTESFDAIETTSMAKRGVDSNGPRGLVDLEKNGWRTPKRATLSSESSDNLELDDSLENRRARRPPKRVPSTSVVDIFPLDSHCLDNEIRRLVKPVRKPSRIQKSSESSELGSTDTLDSERRNKSSDSTETLDSLEKDVEQDTRYEDITDNAREKRDKSDSWSATTTEMETPNGDEDSNRPLVSPDKSYWRQSSESKENIDIHQLLAITIVNRMSDNGNNQRNNAAPYPKKKQQQQQSISPPSSPVVAQQHEQDKLFNNLLANKNDEDLQNMLNGNISEVSTDTKSFKEKLIMFEKLGK